MVSFFANNGPGARDEDIESESDFEIDDEDLRLLKNARLRLEGSISNKTWVDDHADVSDVVRYLGSS